MNKSALTVPVVCLLFFTMQTQGGWEKTGLPPSPDSIGYGVAPIIASGDTLFVKSFGIKGDIMNKEAWSNLYYSANNGASWTGIEGDWGRISDFAVSGNTFILSATNIYGDMGGVIVTTFNGASMRGGGYADLPANTGYTCIGINGNTIFVGTYSAGVALSTNNGKSWSVVNNGLTMGNQNICGFAFNGRNAFAITNYKKCLSLSTDNGLSWAQVHNGLPESATIYALCASGGTIFAGTDSGVFLSGDTGRSWTAANKDLKGVTAFAAFAVYGSDIFAASFPIGISFTSNKGASWTSINSGLTDSGHVQTIATGKGYIFTSAGRWIWRRPLSEIVSVLPSHQNKPYCQKGIRFDASWNVHSGGTLRYGITSCCRVRLGIYTITGKKVASFEQGEQSPGEYRIGLAKDKIPAGPYVYRFQAGSFYENNRMRIIQ